MSHQPVIDGFEFATAGATQEGTLPLRSFPRLQDALVSDSGEAAYTLRGVRDERGRLGLRLQVRATLQLCCQRCLGVVAHEADTDEILVLAASQEEIDADPITVDMPTRVMAGKEMAVRDLVEDELILALPYVSRHEDCEASPEGRDAEHERAARSPFAGLRGMMQRKH